MFATVDPVANHHWQCNSPADAACVAVWQMHSPSSQDICSLQREQWQWSGQDSLVAKFNLICADSWKIQFANSLTFLGAFVGAGVFGLLCDRWGRRMPLFLSTALIAASMLASLAASNFWAMAALRSVTGAGAAGQAQALFLLATEPVGPAYRGLAGTITLLAFAVGEFIMVELGFALPAWQHLLVACAAINAAALLLYPLVSESPRWLLSQGRTEEARAVLQQIARANQTGLLPWPKSQPSDHSSSGQHEGSLEAGTASYSPASSAVSGAAAVQDGAALGLWQLLRQHAFAARLLVLLLNWFGLMAHYYGISMGSGGISGSIYITFAVGVVAEVIALLLVCPALDTFGRHNLLAFGQFLGGAACVGCVLVSSGGGQAALAGVAKFGCSVGQPAMMIYTAELVPTYCRSSVMGMCSQASRLGSFVAPFLLMLGVQLGPVGGYSQVFVPFLVFGALALLGGFCALLMPETLGAPMPEKAEDLDDLVSPFTAKPWRDGCIPLLSFLVRRKAAFAYDTYACKTCRAHTCTCFKPGAS